jgi:hypothetical protein
MPSPRWPKGTSGNPGGRPALDSALKARLAALTPRAIDRLAEALEGDDARLAVTAAMALLDRSLGRPATSAELTVRNGVDYADAHLRALLEMAGRRALTPPQLEDDQVTIEACCEPSGRN